LSVRIALLFLVLTGCVPELPPCDVDAALTVAFLDTGIAASDNNGVPMYAGQALVYAGCSSAGQCHAASARGEGRYGVPLGLDFDIGPRCIDADCETDTERFSNARANITGYARLMQATIERGMMPPGALGRAVASTNGTFYTLDADALAAVRDGASLGDVGVALPRAEEPEGRAIVANWLACGAPVVELTATPQGADPGTDCAFGGDIGSCVHRLLVPLEAPEPTFESIYETYLAPSCTSCHGEGPSDRRRESGLDLSTIDIAYAALLTDATGEACSGGAARVVPGDASLSLLIDKLGSSPTCGDPMGGPRGAPTAVTDAIRTWIDLGAAR
jgi:hypothetical protein